MVGRLAGQRSHHAKASYIHKKDTTHRAANIAVSRVAAGKEANYPEILSEVVRKDAEKKESEEETDSEIEMTVSQSRIMSEHGSIEVYEESKRRSKKKKSKKLKKENNATRQQQNFKPNPQQTFRKIQQQNSVAQQPNNLMMNLQQPLMNLQQPMMNLLQPMMTLAPILISFLTACSPIPLPPPVIRTVFPPCEG